MLVIGKRGHTYPESTQRLRISRYSLKKNAEGYVKENQSTLYAGGFSKGHISNILGTAKTVSNLKL